MRNIKHRPGSLHPYASRSTRAAAHNSRANSRGGREGSCDGRAKQEVLPAASRDGLFLAMRLTPRSCSGPPCGRSSPLHGVVTASRHMTPRDHLLWKIHLLQECLEARIAFEILQCRQALDACEIWVLLCISAVEPPECLVRFAAKSKH
jgi:hypothetical protein